MASDQVRSVLPCYHARYYNPALARFVSADSIIPGQQDKGGTANPQELNRYSYVNNNPVRNTDPTGHCSAGFSWGMVNGQCYQETFHQYMDPSRSGMDRLIGFMYAQADIALVSVATVAVVPLVEAAGSAVVTQLAQRTATAAVPEETAYDIAQAGGRNAGLLKTFATRGSEEIQRSINSLQKQAALHLDKIADPSSYATKWSEMSEQEQSGLLRYWAKEADRYAEQAEVLSGILKERKGDS